MKLYSVPAILKYGKQLTTQGHRNYIILSRASQAGSPTNRLGSGQRRDTDQGPCSPSTGGLKLTLMGSLQPAEFLKGSTGIVSN